MAVFLERKAKYKLTLNLGNQKINETVEVVKK